MHALIHISGSAELFLKVSYRKRRKWTALRRSDAREPPTALLMLAATRQRAPLASAAAPTGEACREFAWSNAGSGGGCGDLAMA